MTAEQYREKCMSKFLAYEQEKGDETEARIEQHRKGDCVLRLVDKEGNAVAGKTVRVRQKNHDFKYGANIFMLDEFPDEKRNIAYREEFSKYFNLATVPFFWQGLEPERNKPRYSKDSPKVHRRPAPDLCVEYCEEKGIMPKLHCLFYDKFLPDWAPKGDKEQMWALYEKRFSEIAERYRGRMYEFEVTNELLEIHYWKDGRCSVLCDDKDTPLRCYELARKYFPGEKLVINEANYLPENAKKGYYSQHYMLLDNLLRRGAQIDKIGVQNHIFCGSKGPQDEQLPLFMKYFEPESIIKGCEFLSDFGKPLEITEVTIPTLGGQTKEAEQLQADLLRAMYRLWFSVPLMESVVYWNVADGTAWINPVGLSNENNCFGGLFHNDMTPKASAYALKELFDKEWHTEAELVTDENGEIRFRGFYGEYDVEVGGERFGFGLHHDNAERQSVTLN